MPFDERAGGFVREPEKIVMGGPMMGLALGSLDVPVTKGTNGLLALCRGEDKAGQDEKDPNQPDLFNIARTDYDECLACQ